MNSFSEFRYLNFRDFFRARPVWLVFPILFTIITFILGVFGFYAKESNSLAHAIYSTFRLFIFDFDIANKNNYHYSLEWARWFAAATVLSSLGYLIATSSYYYVRLFVTQRNRNLTVVFGLNKYSIGLVMDLLSKKQKVIVIDFEGHNSYVTTSIQHGAVVIAGHLYDVQNLKSAFVHKAKRILFFCMEDSANIESLLQMTDYLAQNKKGNQIIKVKVHLKHQAYIDILDDIQIENRSIYELSSFNVYENAVRVLFDRQPFYDSVGATVSGYRPHMLIVGFGHCGEQVFIEASKLAHFLNGETMKVTVIDLNAEQCKDIAHQKYPLLLDMFEMEFIEANAESYAFEQIEEPSYIVISTNNEMTNISLATRLKNNFHNANLYTKMSSDVALSKWFNKNQNTYSQLHTFSVGREVISEEVIIGEQLEKFGQKIHEIYCKHTNTQKEWGHLNLFDKMSNIMQADHNRVKLSALGLQYTPDKTNALSKEEIAELVGQYREELAISEHNRWRAHYYRFGWEPAGDNQPRDNKRKKHPALVEWGRLDEKYKQSNYDFVDKIYEVVQLAGYGVERKIDHSFVKAGADRNGGDRRIG